MFERNGNWKLKTVFLMAFALLTAAIPAWAATPMVAASGNHTVALQADGTLLAWGRNLEGQLGDGTTTNRTSPVVVPGLTGVVAVSAGGVHTVALKADGTVVAWGANSYGQLGNGTWVSSSIPVAVPGLTGVVAVAASYYHTVALKADGSVWAWGANGIGQLGDGTTTDRLSPVGVLGFGGVALPALSYSAESGYGTVGVSPATGTASTVLTYKVVYTQAGNIAPILNSVIVCIDTGTCSEMSVDTSAAAALQDGNYTNGEQYVYTTSLAAGGHTYYFTASDGTNIVYLPASGSLSGPTVSSLSITTATLPDGTVGAAYSQALAAAGGTAPYTWLAPGLPAGLSINTSTGVISGTPTTTGTYGFNASVTDANSAVFTKAFSIIVAAAPVVPPVSSTSWTTMAPMPTPVYGAATGMINGIMYVAGGANSSGPNAGLQAYNPATNAWSALAPMPGGRYQGDGAAVINGQLYVVGGWTWSPPLPNNNLWAYNPATNAWSTLAGMPILSGCGTNGVINGKLYVTTGCNGYSGWQNFLHVYDPATNVWSALASSPDAHASGMGAAINGKFYVVGGVGSTAATSATLDVYDPATNVWTTLAAMPTARQNGAAAVINSKLYVIGGYSAANAYVGTVEAYDPATNTWSTEVSMTTPRQLLAATAGVNGAIYAVGGSDATGSLAVNEAFAPATPPPADATPPTTTASPAGGTYTSAQSVTLTANETATIYYTTDGSTPTTSSAVYMTPIIVSSSKTIKYFAVDSSNNSSVVQTQAYTITGGAVWAWGYNGFGQLGDGTTTNRSTPIAVSGLTSVVAVEAGQEQTLSLKSDGTIWAWGQNDSGQLGDGTTTDRDTPVQVTGLTGIVSVSTSTHHTLALKSDGTVWAWGYNGYGQLGDGTTTQRTTPVQVLGITDVVAISAGAVSTNGSPGFSIALKSDGTVWAWGFNWYGAIGDGTNTDRWTPVQVPGLTGVVVISAGDGHSLALKSDGTVWAWGYNTYGELGDGTNTNRWTPVQANGLAGVTAIATGAYHSLAVRNDGTVWAWGQNTYGQLGDGTTTDRYTPVQVSGFTGGIAVTAGWYHSLARKSDGTVRVWGNNESGQLGDGTTTQRTIPVPVSGLTGIAAIEAGYFHSLAIAPILVDATPPTTTASPAGGTYTSAQSITLTCSDGTGFGCGNIYYTTNGTTPDIFSTVYTVPINISANTTLKYFAVDLSGNGELVKTAVYTIVSGVGIDLTVSSLSAPVSAATGTNISIPNTIRNQGTVTSTTSYVKFYLSSDTVIDATTDVYLAQRSVGSLAAGASSSATTSLKIPVSVAPGTYYIGAIADATNTNTESDETNNTASTTAITVSSGVDLTVSSFSAPLSIATGVNVSLSNTVRNLGTGTTVTSYVKFYLSTDAAIDSSDTYLTQRSIGALAGGATSSASTTIKLPVTLSPGTYYIGAIADETNTNVESDETNNKAVSGAITVTSGIDLIVSSISGPSSAVTGSSISVANTVNNNGTGTSTTSYLKLYLSSDTVIDPATDTYLTQRSISALAGGALSSANTTISLPATLSPGTYYIGAIADETNTNVESNETNNKAVTGAITVTSGIDLIVSSISGPPSAVTGSSISVANTVNNNGTGTSTTSYLKLYLSSDTVIDPATDTYLTQRSISALAGGALSSANTTISLPATLSPGTYYIGAIADETNTNVESNETNNKAVTGAITVTTP